ncbi:hypothetical protein AOLI_G00055290 [Acnodon oligacanthus]
MQRWVLVLAAHDYSIQYREASHYGNADGLSRLPIPTSPKEKSRAVDRFHIRHLEVLPVNCKEICRESRTDHVLAQVVEMVSTGHFPRVQDGDSTLAPFISRKSELTLQQGCLMWGIRVVIPPKLRPRVLYELHSGHPGVVKMKAVARSYMWWPGIDAQIEQVSKTCQACQLTQKAPGPSPLHLWAWPGSPWRRIHVNFAGPFQGHMFMVVVDAHSKWPEVHLMSSTMASKTIQVLRGLLSRYGLPEVLVSDNGPQFTLDYGRGEKWTPGVVSAETGPVSYIVNFGSSEHWRRHADQMLARHAELDASANGEPTSSYAPAELPVLENNAPKPDTYPSPEPVNVSSPQVTSEKTNTQPQETAKQYSSRVTKPPVHYSP